MPEKSERNALQSLWTGPYVNIDILYMNKVILLTTIWTFFIRTAAWSAVCSPVCCASICVESVSKRADGQQHNAGRRSKLQKPQSSRWSRNGKPKPNRMRLLFMKLRTSKFFWHSLFFFDILYNFGHSLEEHNSEHSFRHSFRHSLWQSLNLNIPFTFFTKNFDILSAFPWNFVSHRNSLGILSRRRNYLQTWGQLPAFFCDSLRAFGIL